jgi:hypothetical protein
MEQMTRCYFTNTSPKIRVFEALGLVITIQSVPVYIHRMSPQGPQGSCGPNEVWSYGEKIEPLLSDIVRFRNDVL